MEGYKIRQWTLKQFVYSNSLWHRPLLSNHYVNGPWCSLLMIDVVCQLQFLTEKEGKAFIDSCAFLPVLRQGKTDGDNLRRTHRWWSVLGDEPKTNSVVVEGGSISLHLWVDETRIDWWVLYAWRTHRRPSIPVPMNNRMVVEGRRTRRQNQHGEGNRRLPLCNTCKDCIDFPVHNWVPSCL